MCWVGSSWKESQELETVLTSQYQILFLVFVCLFASFVSFVSYISFVFFVLYERSKFSKITCCVQILKWQCNVVGGKIGE